MADSDDTIGTADDGGTGAQILGDVKSGTYISVNPLIQEIELVSGKGTPMEVRVRMNGAIGTIWAEGNRITVDSPNPVTVNGHEV